MEIRTDNNLQSAKPAAASAQTEALQSNEKKEPQKIGSRQEKNPDFIVNLSKESLNASSSLESKGKTGEVENSQRDKLQDNFKEDDAQKAALQIKQELSGLNIGITGNAPNRLASIFG